jgi:hypothetical protein
MGRFRVVGGVCTYMGLKKKKVLGKSRQSFTPGQKLWDVRTWRAARDPSSATNSDDVSRKTKKTRENVCSAKRRRKSRFENLKKAREREKLGWWGHVRE